MTTPLFIPEIDAPDLAYNHIRDGENEPAKAARELVENLWQRYAPYADSNFRTEIQTAFDERFWEMYLTCSLLDLNLPVSCPKPGPDVCLSLEKELVWIEAICPGPGSEKNPDRVPDYNFGASTATRVPDDEVILRLRHAIETKFRVFDCYAKKGIVSLDAARVVAINGCQVPHARDQREVAIIMRSVLPIGNLQIMFPRDPNAATESSYQYRRVVERRNSAEVETDIFFQDKYRKLSAVLYSCVDACNPTQRLGEDFILIHNPRATIPLPQGMISRGREYRVREAEENFSLETIDHV
jgi:type I restriction enzyme S subunit